ncbi:MAG: SufD family Fe-S cluster assembly protein [Bacilli bacterium]|nr:SufD family Fe-S cluster assembly protein [Bacilli bacterium]MDD3304712.1 SufD family Fe-S cluster assembly protein [Bacilli bacterium]MDD4053609.1 SufD family Fe-S cluster assembly protein [Bacilli bacterium]MDD4411108.1 SufD family Fe-S cluster assembly protein [Bacilli bacterium]
MMNKIEVLAKNKIQNDVAGTTVTIKGDTLNINVTNKCSESIMIINNIYQKVLIMVDDNVSVSLLEIKDDKISRDSKYKYIISNNSKVIINKFYYMNEYNEDVSINLDGFAAEVLFNLSVMSSSTQKYNININHNNKNTISNIYNHGVTFDSGSIELLVNGFVKRGMCDSVLNQDNKIMTMGNGTSIIKPNLFIDEYMVEARHGASIGRFSEDEIFYLQTRGIPPKEGYYLLMKGFLLETFTLDEDVKHKLEKIIEKIGR